jgi:hypothetical protein
MVYGLDEGWDPLPGGVTSESPAVDRDGRVWLATGNDDIRVFDPGSRRWDTLQASDFGFTPADLEYQGHYLTDVVVSTAGEVWVSDCIGMGEGLAGQGVRYLHNSVWTAIPEVGDQCVHDLELDDRGRMYLAGTSAIPFYDPTLNAWGTISPPPWDRFQYIVDVDFTSGGTLVAGSMQCGGASCTTIAFFFRQGDAWLPLLASDEYWWPAPEVALGEDVDAWTCWDGLVYHQVGNADPVMVGGLHTSSCEVAVDSSGIVWVAAFNGADMGVWQVEP